MGDRFEVTDGREYPWFRIHNEIIDVYGGKMGPNCLAIYCALSRHADQKDECWPSHALLAEETGMSVSSVKKAIKRLIELKLIKKDVRRWAKVGPRSTLYTLLELPGGHSRHAPMLQAGDTYAHSRQAAMNNTKVKKTKGTLRTTTTGASLADRKAVLRAFGLRGKMVAEIAEVRDMPWIRAAMKEMGKPEPGGVVFLHQKGWEPPSEEDDTSPSGEDDALTPIFCSGCANLEDQCGCPDPKPRRVLLGALTPIQQRRWEGYLG